MKYRVLGKTGLKVSEIGYGTWQLTNGRLWVGATDNESLKCLNQFVEKGGNFIDTAWVYGYMDNNPDKHPAEELIGKFLKESGKKGKVIIATKIPPKNMLWPARIGVAIEEVFPAEHIEQRVDESLKHLGVETIDLMQFHVWQDAFVEDNGWKDMVQKITKAGKVKHWGISVNDYQPTNCFRAIDTGLISTIQFIFNIFHQKPTEKLFPYAKENNIGLIARVPLDEGGLSGKFTEDTQFVEGDFRSKYFTKVRLKELVKRISELKSLLDGEAKSLPDLDLRYILSFDEISTAIPGMRKSEHVGANVSVSDGRKLSSELVEKIKNHAWERNFYPSVDPAMADSNYLEP